jgi:hypothetical protein
MVGESIMHYFQTLQHNFAAEPSTNDLLGMFLWARLVLRMLEVASSIHELKLAVRAFPKDLEKLYTSILTRITQAAGPSNVEKVIRVLGWISFAKRPLKGHELQYGLILHAENTKTCAETKPLIVIYNICKPLIEDGPNGSVVFAHSSIKE